MAPKIAINAIRNAAPIRGPSGRSGESPCDALNKKLLEPLGYQESSAPAKIAGAVVANSIAIRKSRQFSIFPHCLKANSTARSIAASGDSIVFPWPTARRVGFKLRSVRALSAANSRFQENILGNG